MSPEAKEMLAAEALTLKSNEAFRSAMDLMRSAALEGLASAPATETDKIRDLQAIVRVVDELRGCVESFIRQGQPKKATGIV